MKERLVDLIEKSGMVEKRSRCEIIADELLAAGVCFAPVEIVIRKDITDDMLRQVQNALSMPAMIMPYTPEQESVEIIPRWIPVSERLPEEWVDVLVLSECGFCEVAVYLGGHSNKWRVTWNHDMLDGDVTHWMPLPEPPEEVQK